MKRILIILFTFLMPLFFQNLHAKNRNYIIDEANKYRDYGPWSPTEKNIIDDQIHNEGSSSDPISGKDQIDDRMWARDKNNRWYKSTDNWPYEVGVEVRGEAYAWGGWGNDIVWGDDTTELFLERLNEQPPERFIAGARQEDVQEKVNGQWQNQVNCGIPEGYKGYTGIDCSGFISRVIKPEGGFRYTTAGLTNYCVRVPLDELRPGDLFNNPAAHVIMFLDWITTLKKAKIIHSAAKSFADGTHMRRVISDSANVVIEDGKVFLIHSTGYKDPFIPMTLFPYFTSFYPSKNLVVQSNNPIIQLQIKSGTSIILNSIKLKVNGNEVTPKLSYKTLNIINISYNPSSGLPLGNNSISVSACNELGLVDSVEYDFTIDTVPAFAEYINIKQDNRIIYQSYWQPDTAGTRRLMIYTEKGINSEKDARIQINFNKEIDPEPKKPKICIKNI
ncbi:MAG: hypothetical protein PHF84_04935, partial [bacterium]|nr:hypothetical protein [bacterium]